MTPLFPGETVRGAFLAKEPDSSIGGVPVGYCPDDDHMEEEEVQLQVQAKENRRNTRKGTR